MYTMGNNRVWGVLLGGALLLSFMAQAAHAEIYVWKSADGSVHFSDKPKSDKWQRFDEEKVPERVSSSPGDGELDHARLNQHIAALSRKYNIHSDLIRAVIKAESDFNPKVVSRAGAVGLMQLMPGTAEFVGVNDSFDPYQNVEGGVRYLNYLVQRFGGHLINVLAGYNAGPEAVERYGGVPPYPETIQYVRRVVTYYRAYRDQSAPEKSKTKATVTRAPASVARVADPS